MRGGTGGRTSWAGAPEMAAMAAYFSVDVLIFERTCAGEPYPYRRTGFYPAMTPSLG